MSSITGRTHGRWRGWGMQQPELHCVSDRSRRSRLLSKSVCTDRWKNTWLQGSRSSMTHFINSHAVNSLRANLFLPFPFIWIQPTSLSPEEEFWIRHIPHILYERHTERWHWYGAIRLPPLRNMWHCRVQIRDRMHVLHSEMCVRVTNTCSVWAWVCVYYLVSRSAAAPASPLGPGSAAGGTTGPTSPGRLEIYSYSYSVIYIC